MTMPANTTTTETTNRPRHRTPPLETRELLTALVRRYPEMVRLTLADYDLCRYVSAQSYRGHFPRRPRTP
jgi:hypothetical protein